MMESPSHDSAWLQQAIDTIREARAQGQSIRIEGHGSKAFYGPPPSDESRLLSTQGHQGIVDYDPTELVVVAKSGTPITELEQTLDASGQMLAFEPPRFNGQGTVGGMMATGLSGPRRMSAGAAKDFVLGMTVLDAQATPLRYGGTVMKNVAGYDLSRLNTGAMGTMGLIVDVSLKVLPKPPADETLVFEMSAQDSIDTANRWAGQPLPMVATVWRDGRFYIRLAGAVAAVTAAIQKLGGEQLSQASAHSLWQGLRDHADNFFKLNPANPAVALWRLSVPSVAPLSNQFAEPQLIEWGGALRWIQTDAPADRIRQIARAAGGHATLFRSVLPETRRSQGVFSEISPALMKIHQRLKREIDPDTLFNPGRLYPGL
jgi:glycolate oxidase FAD binding subunit